MKNDEPICYTIDEVAAKLKIGRSKSFELVRTGELRARRIGRLLRVPKVALDEFLNSRG